VLHQTYLAWVGKVGGTSKRPMGTARDLGNGHAVITVEGPWARPVARWTPALGEQKRKRVEAAYAELVRKHGPERADVIGRVDRNVMIFPNLIILDLMGVVVRKITPTAAGHTRITQWSLATAGEDPDMRARRLENFITFQGPGGFATPDDLEALEACQAGYRTGAGVPWSAFGTDGIEAQADTNRPLALKVLPREWLPAIPDVHERLSAGGARVADVACGGGWSSIGIALAYPEVRVDGYDVSVESIELARANARAAGVADRVSFHVLDASGPAPDGAYDLVLVLEAVHDMARPVEALATMRALSSGRGAVLVIDERTNETFTAPGDESERALYGFSLFCCLPAGRSETPSAATGTVMRPDTLRGDARDAGFADVEVLPIEHDAFRLYRLV
jgi:ubiquinone/menaquinone biosynthesis C-methylase UbiE